MFFHSVAMVTLLVGTIGRNILTSPVINIEKKDNGLWAVEVWRGGYEILEDDGKLDYDGLDRHFISILYVKEKERDSLTGKLILDELRESLKTKMDYYIMSNEYFGRPMIVSARPSIDRLHLWPKDR